MLSCGVAPVVLVIAVVVAPAGVAADGVVALSAAAPGREQATTAVAATKR